jgi:3',5'-cyclic AMP phosphodiesterase CpdA
MPIRVVAISDTHGAHDEFTLPDGDVLLHGGDFSRTCSQSEYQSLARWFSDAACRSFSGGIFVTVSVFGVFFFCFVFFLKFLEHSLQLQLQKKQIF